MEITEALLSKFYISDKLSVAAIAKKFECSEHKINYWIAKYEIQKRSISESLYLHHNPLGDPFKIVSPRTIEDATLFGLGVGLYWGEGTKSSKMAVRLGNTDPKLIKTFIEFLVKICGINTDKLRFGLQIFSDMQPMEALQFWCKELKVSASQFQKIVVTPARGIGTYHHKTRHGVLTVNYCNTKLRNIMLNIVENITEKPG